MNPAYSVIFFTVFSGAGYGLLALSALAATSHGQASSPGFAYTVLATALTLITAGLLSSTVHLGRPERAWRAFSQWRTSWLSREGIAAILTYPASLAFGAVWSGLVDAPGLIAPLALLTTALCIITIFCTGMIYQSLKTIPAWHSKLTTLTYLAFAGATGSGLLNVIAFSFGRFQTGAGRALVVMTLAFTLACTILKILSWRKLRRKTYTMAQATGLGETVRQWEQPHTASNFIMKEMGFQVAQKHAKKLQTICALLLDVAFVAATFSLSWPWLVFITAPCLILGAWVERWLFFAQAEHVVGLFYGKQSV